MLDVALVQHSWVEVGVDEIGLVGQPADAEYDDYENEHPYDLWKNNSFVIYALY